MKMPEVSLGQVYAFGRHVVSYGLGAVTAVSFAHLWGNPADAQNAANAINQLGHGFGEVVGALATLGSLGMGVIAAAKSSPIVQMIMGATALLRNNTNVAAVSSDDQKTIMEATLKLPKVDAVVTNDNTIAASTPPGIVAAQNAVIKS